MQQVKLTKCSDGVTETVTFHLSHYVHVVKLAGRIERVSERYDRTGTTRNAVIENFRAQGFVHEDEVISD